MTRDHVVLTWDWRGQIDLEALADAVWDMSGGEVRITEVDTGGDEYAIVVSDADEMTPEEAYKLYEGRR